MFAVPGWSVSSSLLKAEQPEGARNVAKVAEQEVAVEGESKKSSKKRKRNAEMAKKGPKVVNVGNMEELWETVIEGRPKEKKPENGEKKEKKKKVNGDDVTGEAAEGEESKATLVSKLNDANGSGKTVPRDQNEDLEAPKERVKKGKTKKEKKREKKARLEAIADGTGTATDTGMAPTPESISMSVSKTTPQPSKSTLTPLQASMRQKLISARFRHLNQTLYTTPSAQSLSLFAENPEMFTEYHEGFRRQVEVWPENPVDIYIAQILSRGVIKGPSRGNPLDKTKEQALPRTEGTCTLADLGCGDAALSTSLQPHLKKLKMRIHSFDLQSPSPLVMKADIANLPLKDGSVDIAIFCLALMGTNWVDFIEEAFRILRWKGELWIAEIKSRFGRVANAGSGNGSGKRVVDHSVGNRKRPLDRKTKKSIDEAADEETAAVEVDGQEGRGGETDVSAFVEVLRKRGFVLKGEGQGGEKSSVDLRNRMFVRMCFVKGTAPIKGKCVPVPKGAQEFANAGGKGAETWKRKAPKGKLTENDIEEDAHVSSEAGVLKPCVYKLR